MPINTIVSTLNNKIQKSYISYGSLFLLIFILFPVSSIGQNLLKNVDLNKYPIKLVGTLNGKRITLYVSQNNKSIEGLYYYGKYTEYLTLEGQIDDRNQIYLNEYNSFNDYTGKFSGSLNYSSFGGDWTNSKGTKSHSFSTEVTQGHFEKIQSPVIDTSSDYNDGNSTYIFVIGLIIAVIIFFKIIKRTEEKATQLKKANEAKEKQEAIAEEKRIKDESMAAYKMKLNESYFIEDEWEIDKKEPYTIEQINDLLNKGDLTLTSKIKYSYDSTNFKPVLSFEEFKQKFNDFL
jgi:hypothetical protein